MTCPTSEYSSGETEGGDKGSNLPPHTHTHCVCVRDYLQLSPCLPVCMDTIFYKNGTCKRVQIEGLYVEMIIVCMYFKQKS